METKKTHSMLLIVLGAVLVIAIGALVYFANQPTSSKKNASAPQTNASMPSNYKLNPAVKNSTEALNSLPLPQLNSHVARDEAEVQLNTTAGAIKIKLFPKLAPNAVQNFLVLAKHGYYKNNEFFRVMKNFMIQTGDPSNTGTGSQSIFNNQPFATEISNQLYHIRGALSLANTGAENSSSSQFFIVQSTQDLSSQISKSVPDRIKEAYKKGGYPSLDGSYTVFGQVISGLSVVDKIALAEVTTNSSGENSKPVHPVTITSVKIIKDWKF